MLRSVSINVDTLHLDADILYYSHKMNALKLVSNPIYYLISMVVCRGNNIVGLCLFVCLFGSLLNMPLKNIKPDSDEIFCVS